MKLTKKRKVANEKIEKSRLYSLQEASELISGLNCTKFDASVDLHVRLNVDVTKPDQAIRGTANLPHGTGKTKKVLVLCNPDKEAEAKAAGADYVGLDDYIQKIEKENWLDVDVVVAVPGVMAKIGKLGKVLGPRNLMPNPKVGTVTDNVKKAVEDIKSGKIAFKADKTGIVHVSVGRVSFGGKKIKENVAEVMTALNDMKPTSVKGIYIHSIYMTSTMSPSVPIDIKSIA